MPSTLAQKTCSRASLIICFRVGTCKKALRTLMQRGMTDRHGRVMPGLQDILKRLRAMKEQQLRQYNPNSALDDLRRRLDDIVARERQTLDAQLAATRQRLDDLPADTDPETAQQRANEARAVQEMEELVAERQAQLDALPRDVGDTIRGLQQYDFIDQQARADFAALLQSLQQQAMDSLLQSLTQHLHNMTSADMQRMRHMLEDLNRLLEQRAWGEEGDFQRVSQQAPRPVSRRCPRQPRGVAGADGAQYAGYAVAPE